MYHIYKDIEKKLNITDGLATYQRSTLAHPVKMGSCQYAEITQRICFTSTLLRKLK